ncbi:MAG: Asp-tRNA(Asn)/Glu-tRNA(Gln) amidotransferase subunit GatB [Cyclobacteriaceae bacterium]
MNTLESMQYEMVVGLEIHAQLSTKSKIYSSDATTFGCEPNTNISVITLAHPGTMPKLNKKVIEYAIKMGLACQCDISRYNIFCRKNYFYPDLPKGYQLTQDKTPICKGGSVAYTDDEGREKSVQLNRIHIEEDAGKSLHPEGKPYTMVDLNRAGVALIEIVTEPDIYNAADAAKVVSEVRKLVRYLDICDGNMEEGSLRCDANVSVKPKGSTTLGRKVELKNMNSIKQVRQAIEHEVQRQLNLIASGNTIVSETRTFDPVSGSSISMREKEELNDYRYFPEPDLSPVMVTDAWLHEINATMPLLPYFLKKRFVDEFGLSDYDAAFLTESREVANYFLAVCEHTQLYKNAANWIMGPVQSAANDAGLNLEHFPLLPVKLAGIIELIHSGKITYTMAVQQLMPALIQKPTEEVEQLAIKLNLVVESNTDSLKALIEKILADYPEKVKEYRKGKKGLLGMFMGELMKQTKGKADPKVAGNLLKDVLEEK